MTYHVYIAETTLYRWAGFFEGLIATFILARFGFWWGFLAFLLMRFIVGQLLALIMATVPTVSRIPPK